MIIIYIIIARVKIFFNKYQKASKIFQKKQFKNIKIKKNLKKTMNIFQINQ